MKKIKSKNKLILIGNINEVVRLLNTYARIFEGDTLSQALEIMNKPVNRKVISKGVKLL